MDTKKYNLTVGIVLLIATFGFFALPSVLTGLDPFIPVMMAIVSLILAIGFFFMGLSER